MGKLTTLFILAASIMSFSVGIVVSSSLKVPFDLGTGDRYLGETKWTVTTDAGKILTGAVSLKDTTWIWEHDGRVVVKQDDGSTTTLSRRSVVKYERISK